MTDYVDRASEREQEMLADALAEQARRAGLAGKTVADSASTCEDCGGRISVARRKAVPGCLLCVECQAAHERAHR
jgi:phage/conjugal plasmid C-4 type zinc finger TraR family protein